MKYSKQRELIFQAVREYPYHPSADEVYSRLKLTYPSLSLGTVYRNLNQLSEQGLIAKIKVPNGSDRFDGETKQHYHMVCSECGRLFDVRLTALEGLDQILEQEYGFTVTGHHLLIDGICKQCKEKEGSQGHD